MKPSKSQSEADEAAVAPAETVSNIAPQDDQEPLEADSEPLPRKREDPPEGFDPLGMAPPEAKVRYAKTAEVAHCQPKAATKLKCLDCCGWDYAEAKRCEIQTCPEWAMNRRIFKKRGKPPGAEPAE